MGLWILEINYKNPTLEFKLLGVDKYIFKNWERYHPWQILPCISWNDPTVTENELATWRIFHQLDVRSESMIKITKNCTAEQKSQETEQVERVIINVVYFYIKQ